MPITVDKTSPVFQSKIHRALTQLNNHYGRGDIESIDFEGTDIYGKNVHVRMQYGESDYLFRYENGIVYYARRQRKVADKCDTDPAKMVLTFVHLIDLQSERYSFIQTDTDLEVTLESAGVPVEYRKDITGAVVEILDGEYGEVWLTEDVRFYDLKAIYRPLNFYTAPG